MEFDESFIKEEVRCDFFVSEKRKKVWYVELELLRKFDEVCKKYNLTYFVEYGTLLGAVRHNGFIPWDDDIDIIKGINIYKYSLIKSWIHIPKFNSCRTAVTKLGD